MHKVDEECRALVVEICDVVAKAIAFEYGGYSQRIRIATHTAVKDDDLWTKRILIALWSAHDIRNQKIVDEAAWAVEHYRDGLRGTNSVSDMKLMLTLDEIKKLL